MYPQWNTLQIWNKLRLVISLIANYTACFSKKLNSRRWNNNIPMIMNAQKKTFITITYILFTNLALNQFQLYGILDTCHAAHGNNNLVCTGKIVL